MSSPLLRSKAIIPATAVAALAALMPIAAFIEKRAIVPLAIVSVIAGLAASFPGLGRPAAGDKKFLVILALFCSWAAISAIWSLDPFLALRGAAKVTGNLVLGVFLFHLAATQFPQYRRVVGYGLIAGLVITLIAMTTDMVFDAPISFLLMGSVRGNAGLFWLNASAAVLVLLFWPAMLFLIRTGNKFFALIIFSWVLVVVILLNFQSGVVALAVGLVAWGAAYFLRQRLFRVMAVLSAIGVFILPVVTATIFDPAIYAPIEQIPKPAVHRFHIWKFTTDRIAERPFLGWGMNAARVFPGGKATVRDDQRGSYGDVLPLHPHNGVLQIWLELGIPGIVLTAAFLVFFFLRLAGAGFDPATGAFVFGQVMAASVLVSVSYGMWQSWWLVTLWCSASIMLVMARETARTEPLNQ